MANVNTRRQRRKHRMAEMNVVPYIDVMLVLLIIFMITSPLLVESMNVELPQVELDRALIPPAPTGTVLVISMDAESRLYFQDDTEPMTQPALFARLTHLIGNYAVEYGKKPTVYLAIDERLPYGKAVNFMAALRELDLVEVGLVMSKQ